ncbi:hypothetical protein O0L34_g16186 [Tuta absoluta]|nr:hypothetical protein O0L34_g16186 [Tuta absoluta]
MNQLRKRRDSMASVYRKTTKFLTSNTTNLLKKMPNNKKYRQLTRVSEDYEPNEDFKIDKNDFDKEIDEEDRGERDLDFYLGVRNKESFWRDPEGKEQIRRDFLLYHCGVSEEDYEENYKASTPKSYYAVQPKLKQVPFKIHKKRSNKMGKEESWCEKTRLFKLFANKRDSEISSDSYSEVESEEVKAVTENDQEYDDVCGGLDEMTIEGVRIKEVSEGRPCDNCPELCPGFSSHPWR